MVEEIRGWLTEAVSVNPGSLKTGRQCQNWVFLQHRYVFNQVKHVARYLFLVAIVFASGCSKDVVENVATAWSDDSEQIAFLERSYKKTYNVSDYSIKNIEYRIGTIGRNG